MARGASTTNFIEATMRALGFGTTTATPTSPTEEFIINALTNPEITWEEVKTGLSDLHLQDTVKALITHLTDTNLDRAQAILKELSIIKANFETAKISEYVREAKSAFFHEVRFSRSANEETRIEFLSTAIYLELRRYTEAVDREFAKYFSSIRSASRPTEAAGGAGAGPSTHAPALATTMRTISSSSEDLTSRHSSTSLEGQ